MRMELEKSVYGGITELEHRPCEYREPTESEKGRYWQWLRYAYQIVAAFAYERLPIGGMLLVRQMNPLHVEFIPSDEVRRIGPRESGWIDAFNRETTLIIGFVAKDGTVATLKVEGADDDSGPGAMYRELTGGHLERKGESHGCGT